MREVRRNEKFEPYRPKRIRKGSGVARKGFKAGPQMADAKGAGRSYIQTAINYARLSNMDADAKRIKQPNNKNNAGRIEELKHANAQQGESGILLVSDGERCQRILGSKDIYPCEDCASITDATRCERTRINTIKYMESLRLNVQHKVDV